MGEQRYIQFMAGEIKRSMHAWVIELTKTDDIWKHQYCQINKWTTISNEKGMACLLPAAVLRRRTDTGGGHAHALESMQDDCNVRILQRRAR